MSNPPAAFSGALRPQNLIGRESQLEQISTQIAHPDLGDAFRCVLITADGGKGKTRLLQEVGRRFQGLPEAVIVLPLIDLADPTLHSVAAFLRHVRRALGGYLNDAEREMLAPFDQASAEYEQAHRSEEELVNISQANTGLIATFRQFYQKLTAGRRVVWMLDTMEQLFATPPEIEDLIRYDSAIHLTEIGPTTYHWLLNFIIARTQNTTLLLAGRPVPGRWVTGIQNALHKSDIASIPEGDEPLPETAAPAVALSLSVDDFSADETDRYLDALQERLDAAPALADQDDFLSGLRASEEAREVLFLLTEGNPIRLALYVDLLVSGGVFPEPFRMPLAELRQRIAADREDVLSSVDDDLLSYIAGQLGEALSQVLDYLSIMRRGLDRQRLARIWGSTLDEAEAALGHLGALSFIKYRPDGRYFLHDELYQIYQLEFKRRDEPGCAARRDHERAIYARVIALCEEELREQNQVLLAYQPPLDSQERRIRRRQLHAERLHYSLYLDPLRGFYEVYFELAERAFTTYDFELDSLLQSEIGSFFFGGAADLNRLQTGVSADDWEQLRFVVLHERVSGWIKRLTRSFLYSQAQALADAAQRDHAALVAQHYADADELLARYDQPAGQLIAAAFAEEWQACGQIAAIYGGSARTAIGRLQAIIGGFEALMRGRPAADLPAAGLALLAPQFRNRLLNIIAQCTMFVGYAHVTLSAYTQAIGAYRRAEYLLIHARPHLETLLAEVKNNLSRVLGELSRLDDALMLCDEGAAINRRLGLDYSLAIAYNTRALIATTNQRPELGLRFARLALRLFRHRLDLRGIGLALIQTGEGLRRNWWIEAELQAQNEGGPLQSALAETDEAVRDLKNAVEIFIQINEPLRLMESYSALACLYRDRANYLGERPEGENFGQALHYFGLSRKVAEGDEPGRKRFPTQELAILADWAWLYKRAGGEYYAEATRIADEALALAPPGLLLSTERPLDIGAARKEVARLRELSKLAALRADIAAADAAATEIGAAEREQALLLSIEQRILAMAYLQIISPANSYLAHNKRKLYQLLSQQRLRDPQIHTVIERQTRQVVASYHLAALQAELGELTALAMIRELFAPPDDSDYV